VDQKAQKMSKEFTEGNIHLGFLSELFKDFAFPEATLVQLDSVLKNFMTTIKNIEFSWKEESESVDHLVFVYDFAPVPGLKIKVPHLRLFYLHIDQSSWRISVGKSSVGQLKFHMNYMDNIWRMNSSQVSKFTEKLQNLIMIWTEAALDDIMARTAPTVITKGTENQPVNNVQFARLPDIMTVITKTTTIITAQRRDSSLCCRTQADKTHSNVLGLYVGWNGKIALWQPGSIIRWGVWVESFPSVQEAHYAGAQLVLAAQAWNAVNAGVSFEYADSSANATFLLAFAGDGGNMYAEAFFPNDAPLSVLKVYKRAFAERDVMANIFLHELGHVLGLRHEFADMEGGAQIWGTRNPNSVMSYEFPPQMQDSDKRGFANLMHAVATGANSIGVFPVVLYRTR
ncbi:MAG: hypothetical protein IV100_32885, partial [Myxococcales bacterium]|nr:hypothetical protein [Myxococcales bacterium]